MAESPASSALSHVPSTPDQLVGYCAGKRAIDQIERRPVQTYFGTLQEPSEWQEPTDNGERPKPSNFSTPWKEPNSGIIFRCRQPQNSEREPHCYSKVSSLDFSNRTIDTESGPFTPKGQTQSAIPEIQKQTSFTVPHTWLNDISESALPEVAPQTVLDAVLQRTKPLALRHQGNKNQQAQPVASSVEDIRIEIDAKATTKGFKLPGSVDVLLGSPGTKAGGETEVARRIFPPASEQTALDKLLLHEYRVRGILVMPVEIPTNDKGKRAQMLPRTQNVAEQNEGDRRQVPSTTAHPEQENKGEKRNEAMPIGGATRTTYRTDRIIEELDGNHRGTARGEDDGRAHNRRHVRFAEAQVGNPGREGTAGLGQAEAAGQLQRRQPLHDPATEDIEDWMQRVALTKQELEAEAEATRKYGPGRPRISAYMADPRFGPVHAEPGGGFVPLTEEEFRERRRNLMLYGTPTPGRAGARGGGVTGAASRPPAAASAAGPAARNRNMTTEPRPETARHRRQWLTQALHGPDGNWPQRPGPAEERPAAAPAPIPAPAPAQPRNVERPARAAGNQPRNPRPVRRPSRLRRASVVRRPTSTRHTPPSRQTILEIAAQRRAAAAPAGARSGKCTPAPLTLVGVRRRLTAAAARRRLELVGGVGSWLRAGGAAGGVGGRSGWSACVVVRQQRPLVFRARVSTACRNGRLALTTLNFFFSFPSRSV